MAVVVLLSPRRVVVLGSTGSVGRQTADVVRRHPGSFEIVALGAGGGNPTVLAEQIVEFEPCLVGIADPTALDDVRDRVAALASEAGRPAPQPSYLTGQQSLEELAREQVDVVLNGITGSIGLPPTLAALEVGNTLALANKESLVVGGELVMKAARPGQIVPVDSEHSAIAQALRGGAAGEVLRLIITATGGPFRGRQLAELGDVTVEQALAHPKWSMGPVISINSATMANKGLELIEAHLLFDIPYDRITIVVHPQAYIHSMVEFVDGATLAQINPPDLRLPIALGLAWPERVPDAVPGIDWSAAHTWEISPLDELQTPMVALARASGAQGGAAPCVYNAANEVAVDAFRNNELAFPGIPEVVAATLEAHEFDAGELSFEVLNHHDQSARDEARRLIRKRDNR